MSSHNTFVSFRSRVIACVASSGDSGSPGKVHWKILKDTKEYPDTGSGCGVSVGLVTDIVLPAGKSRKQAAGDSFFFLDSSYCLDDIYFF